MLAKNEYSAGGRKVVMLPAKQRYSPVVTQLGLINRKTPTLYGSTRIPDQHILYFQCSPNNVWKYPEFVTPFAPYRNSFGYLGYVRFVHMITFHFLFSTIICFPSFYLSFPLVTDSLHVLPTSCTEYII